MMVGWGEGFDQVADYLNAQPNPGDIVVSTEAWRTPLGYFLEGDARFAAFVDDPGGLFRWASSDYYLLYITPLSRNGVWPDLLNLIEQKTPVLTVTLNGLDYALLYDIRDDTIPPYLEAGRYRHGRYHRRGPVGRLRTQPGRLDRPRGNRARSALFRSARSGDGRKRSVFVCRWSMPTAPSSSQAMDR